MRERRRLRLREYVDAAKGERPDQWVKWARGVADAIDPCMKNNDASSRSSSK